MQQTYAVTYPDERETAQDHSSSRCSCNARSTPAAAGRAGPWSTSMAAFARRDGKHGVFLLRRPHHPTGALDRNAGRRRAARGRGTAAGPGVVRSPPAQAAAAVARAAAADRGHRRRHEYRQVGDLQPPGGRNGQRRHAAGRRHEASRLPRSARLRRPGNCWAGSSSISNCTPGSRPTIRCATRPPIGSIGGWGPRCPSGWCWSMPRTSIPT